MDGTSTSLSVSELITTEISNSNHTTTTVGTLSSDDVHVGDDISVVQVLGYAGCTIFVCLILLLTIAGVSNFLKRSNLRNRTTRSNTLSIFDLATVFNDNRDPYTALRTGEFRSGAGLPESVCSANTHSYTEVNVDNLIFAKSQEELSRAEGGKDLPRKCNTLSGILWNRLGGGWKRNDRATLDRYLTAQRGSTTSANDYVDNCQEDLKYIPMAQRRGLCTTNSFVPEDDNLWERCSSDGSVEHDVTLRQDVDPNRGESKDCRLSTMSDLLRSSWIEMSTKDKEYFNVSRCGSEVPEEIGGVFIPESDLGHPLQDGERDINQVSQNIIDLITENFSSKIQKRESDDWNKGNDDFKGSKTRVDEKLATLGHVLPEPERDSFFGQNPAQMDRTNSYSPIVPEKPDGGKGPKTSGTLPRSQKRALPPVPIRTTPLRTRKTSTSPQPGLKPQYETKEYMNESTCSSKEGTSFEESDDDDYENCTELLPMKPPAQQNVTPSKKIPPPPPPKPKKRIFEPQFQPPSSPEVPRATTYGIQQNFMMVTQQLQQKLVLRLPGQAKQTANESEEDEDLN